MTKLYLTLDEKEEQKLNVLREKYGIKQATELVRFLITKEAASVSSRQAS